VPEFDHLEFPGVVPRTFLGALAVSALAGPGHAALQACPTLLRSLPGVGPTWCPLPGTSSQVLARGCLGLLGWLAFRKFRRGVALLWGGVAGACLGLVCSVQFHLPFYLTRTLPNTMALVVLLWGCALPPRELLFVN
jgi:alpha-1,6-mannosyltransferase